MEQIRWKVDKVIDAHVHYRHREPPAYFSKILDMVGYARANILTGWEPKCLDRKREQADRFIAADASTSFKAVVNRAVTR